MGQQTCASALSNQNFGGLASLALIFYVIVGVEFSIPAFIEGLMSFRFFRRFRIAPGVSINLSKSGASISLGPRGAKYTVGPRGTRTTIGLPGTGLFYTIQQPRKAAGRPSQKAAMPVTLGAPLRPRQRTHAASFSRRNSIPEETEAALLAGLEALKAGDGDAALAAFERAALLPDAAWLAGLLRLRAGDGKVARKHLEHVLAELPDLNRHFQRLHVSPHTELQITPDITAHIFPEERSARLALVEAAQMEGDHDAAMVQLDKLLRLDPDDPVVQLSFCELALDRPGERTLMERVTGLTARMPNESAVDTALLLYRARALEALGLRSAALDVLRLAARRRSGRPAELMQQIGDDITALLAADEPVRDA